MQKLIDAWPMIALGLGCIAVVLALHFISLYRDRRKRPTPIEMLFVASGSERRTRIENLLPLKGREDVSGILKHEFAPPNAELIARDREALFPDNGFDWAIDIDLVAPDRMNELEILASFSRFPGAFDDRPSIYGKSAPDGPWNCCGTRKSGPLTFTQMAFFVTLFSTAEAERLPTIEDLENQLLVIKTGASKIGTMTIQPRVRAREAVERVFKIKAFYEKEKDFNDLLCLILNAPAEKPFAGKEIWDVMRCLGLEWGDMDLFHLDNNGYDGDDHLFSVWTSTAPGYFLPEDIAADRIFTRDLVFGFSLARSADPGSIFRLMLRAANYAQSRLGGEILDSDGSPVDLEMLMANINARAAYLTQAGFKPGSSSAMRLF